MMRDRRLWLLLAAALGVRVMLLPLPERGAFDLTTFWRPWMNYAAQHGLAQLYLHGEPAPVNYPPLYLALLTALGKLYAVFQPDLAFTPLQRVLIKLPAVVADLGSAALLYGITAAGLGDARRSAWPLLAAALWAFNPAVIYVSSVWGQVDAIHTFWMLGALWAALQKRWGWSGFLMALALLTKLQAVAIAPVLLLVTWLGGTRALLRTTLTGAATLGVAFAGLVARGALQPLLNVYFGSVGFYPALSLNAYNPWFIVQSVARQALGYSLTDTMPLLGPLTGRQIGLLLLGSYALLIVGMLLRRWRNVTNHFNRSQVMDAFFAAGLLIFGFFMLATEMHERYSLPALAPLALPAVTRRQVRLPYALLSLSVLLNLIRVLPVTPGQLKLMEALPGDRLLLSLANSALFVWLTLLYLTATGRQQAGVSASHIMERAI